MTPARDRWVAGAALLVLLVLTGVVVGFVLDAQRAGVASRETQVLREVHRLANSMDTRIQQAYSGLAATASGPGTFRMTEGDPTDAAKLVPRDPRARTGAFLVDRRGRIVNGSLLRDAALIGSTYAREGLALALDGEPTVLAVGPGLTTTEPVISVAVPVRHADGALAGAYVLEVENTPDSAFAAEVAQLGGSGTFTFIDTTRRVAASSDETILAERSTLSAEALRPGFHRVAGLVAATADVPAARWKLVFTQPADEFEGDLTRPIRSAVLLLLLTLVVGAALGIVALLRRLRSAREEQRRLREISDAHEEFTSIVSHELRTPVAGLLGFLQTTIDHWDAMADDERRRAVQRAHQNAARLQHLTTEVLDTTGIESGRAHYQFESADLVEVVRSAVEIARDANTGRTIELTVPEEPVRTAVDVARIGQIVTNLLDNALKASPSSEPVEVALTTSESWATVSVRDHGAGIPTEDRERVFDKFTRGRARMTRGSGLGLYLAREIVHDHGGRIWIGEVDGPGSQLVFTLPLSAVDRAR
jgi:signal transduction histidine kinase